MKVALLFSIVYYFTTSPAFAVDSDVIETAYSEMKTYLVDNEADGFSPLLVRLSVKIFINHNYHSDLIFSLCSFP